MHSKRRQYLNCFRSVVLIDPSFGRKDVDKPENSEYSPGEQFQNSHPCIAKHEAIYAGHAQEDGNDEHRVSVFTH